MILCTHALVGGAIASLMPDRPLLALACGIASHFAIDAIPHADYPLRSISIGPGGAAVTLNRSLLRDLGVISLDAAIGLAAAMWLYATPATALTVLLGALGGIVPDPLQLAYNLCPREPLRTIQRFHVWIHAKRKLSWPEGMSSQFLFVLLTIAAVEIIRRA